MQKFRILLIIVAVAAVSIAGVLLINQLNSDSSISSSSASVYNIIGLSQSQDDTLFPNKIAVDINAQILSDQTITSGNLVISYDKDILEVDDIIMANNIIAVNQKIDNADGTVTLEIRSTAAEGFKDITSFAKIIFNKKIDTGKFTTVALTSDSTLGTPNTLDNIDKPLSISF